MSAAFNGHTGCVRLMTVGGANIEAKDTEGSTALIWAANNGHAECVRFLIDIGANKEARDTLKMTALIWAAHDGHTDCVRLLVDSGADKEVKDTEGSTALIWAAHNDHTDCVRLLIVGGAEKKAKDKTGLTALDWAQQKGNNDVVRLISSCSEVKFDQSTLIAMDPKKRARFMGRSCHHCFNTKSEMLRCSLCLKAHYCSKECQKIHWPLHKVICDRGGAPLSSASASLQRSDDKSASSASASVPLAPQLDMDVRANAPTSQSGLDACHFCAKSQSQIAERLSNANAAEALPIARCSASAAIGVRTRNAVPRQPSRASRSSSNRRVFRQQLNNKHVNRTQPKLEKERNAKHDSGKE